MHFHQLQFLELPAPVLYGLEGLTITRSPLPFYNHFDPPPQLALKSLTLDGITSSGYPEDLLWFLTSFHMPQLQRLELANLDHRLQFSAQFVRALCAPAIYPSLRYTKFTSLPLSNITPEFCHALPALETVILVEVDPEPLLSLLRADRALCPGLREIYVDGRAQSR
ncbi:hypothetical protein B0H17DRAFT_1038845 [Mycena rosella]|uniref:Uncharacterized protein n=1 Tax=Mycena rosella TaxID=1033263 RepID=A0AAD7M7S8_MYCRO|nr:hypothetical protein B0H17DRAFT_1038845 [Mycena rosella]